ncbi:MAG: FAD-binding oxidoreductase [Actinobacteria bacterium]|nr:FAD-binding oxidoreductase [Actinomycetota bacterium]
MPYREPIELADGAVTTRLDAPQVDVPEGLVDALRADLGAGAVVTDEAGILPYGRDWWPLAVVWATQGKVPSLPAAVVRVTAPEQVVTVVRRCAEARIPLTVSAGRSGVCGGALPVAGGIVLDVTGLDAILDIDDTSLLVRAQAGIFGDVFEARLREAGYTLGHWPQSIELSTLGGWIACRSAGQYSTRYGKIEDMVVALEAVTGAGDVLRTGGTPRAAVGPDLTQLVLGSEGTLAVVTEATLRIHPLPSGEARTVFGFATFADGLDACRRILRRGATPAVLRLYDVFESQRHFSKIIGETDDNVLIVLDEGDPDLVDATMAVVRAECADAAPLDEAVAGHWLERRNDVSALPEVVKAGVVVDTVEIVARWGALPAVYEDAVAALMAVDGALVASAHCSHSYLDGACLYFTFAGQPGDDPAVKDAYYRASLAAKMDAALRHGAAISHHHGVGMARGAWVRQALGDTGFATLCGLKSVLDPAGILNPGKLGLPSPFLPEGWAWT